ncbi:hypothetical protein L6452_27377 [Arctium lappa]|uniref:Uncharacterized protein n=1 Tax=Arctium lappa TaxID=4217 RepID=A0ACB8ZVQ1_ARCLA|nr:hypothetical protein L6452_27377 [Arctium lappa]
MVTATVADGVSLKKKTKGRKNIEIKKIEETNNRQVTFSKRRTGLFKKASELCVLTEAQIAIFVNSPSSRVFAFGHPTPIFLLTLSQSKQHQRPHQYRRVEHSSNVVHEPV